MGGAFEVLDALKLEFDKQEEKATASAPKPNAGRGDAEIQQMNSQAPLLDLIRKDTGERGTQHDGYLKFKHCPVCCHNDCFCYYEATNTWCCYGGSNTTPKKGGGYSDYLIAAKGYAATEAIAELREVTGNPYPWKRLGRTAHRIPEAQEAEALPRWMPVEAVNPPKRNPELVSGILRRGHTALLAGKGKTGKTWAAIQLSIAIATGTAWFGFECSKGEVLYIDPELDPKSLDNRFNAVCTALGADPNEVREHVSKWPLRGIGDASIGALADCLENEAAHFDLIVMDSCSVFVEGDENSSADIRKFSVRILRITEATGAAVFMIHHYGKGNEGDRSSADRARGSSVWLDFPDAMLTLTTVFPSSGEASDYLEDGECAILLESGGLREFPSMTPKHLIYRYPVHRIDEHGITEGWKPRSGAKGGGQTTGAANAAKAEAKASQAALALMSCFYEHGTTAEGMSLKDATEAVNGRLGANYKADTLKGYIEKCGYFEVTKPSPQRCVIAPKNPPQTAFETPSLDLR